VKVGGRSPDFLPDVDVIRMLAGLLTETGLTEIEYAVGDRRIRVARRLSARAEEPAPVTERAAAWAAATDPAAPPPDISLHPGAVKSPMVGTAFLAPQPGSAPFVRIGDSVMEGQPLLIVEAMKVMNQIRAPRAGRVVRILVEDAAPVEYDAVLMLIE
jgi:acetyl-CoA carboxylase biotin carboxyl carrier protein